MKRIALIFLVFILTLSFAACGEGKPKTSEKVNSGTATPVVTATPAPVDKNFEKPAEYASVLLVTINPQIRLYLDAQGKVLAVEAVNEDALSIKDGLTFENETVETVVKSIVTTAKEKGFIKADAKISIELTETKDESVNKTELLAKAETTVNQTAADLKIEIVVEAEDKTDVVTPSATATETIGATNAATSTPGATSAPQTTTAPTPAKLTPVKEKAGSWFARYTVGKSLYDANFYLSGGADEISAGIGYRELVDDSLDSDMLADAVEFEGKLYYGAPAAVNP